MFPVQPSLLAKYRNAFTPSRAKDDPTDAEFALELLLRYPERLPRLKPESPAMRSLRQLVETRRSVVDDRVRVTNRITASLKEYFPQVLGIFGEKDTGVFAEFLERWPTIEAAKKARRSALEAFFREHNVRYQATIDRRIDALKDEQPLTTDPAVIGPMKLLVELLLPELKVLSDAVERLDREIAHCCAQLADYKLFSALPGAGPALAPRLLAAFGERRERFPNAAALQQYVGEAPGLKQTNTGLAFRGDSASFGCELADHRYLGFRGERLEADSVFRARVSLSAMISRTQRTVVSCCRCRTDEFSSADKVPLGV